MATSSQGLGDAIFEPPPLILHPFNERIPPSTLLDNSRAALMLSGLIPNDGSETEELQRRVLAGRYAEIRMLYFLGKDVMRWIDQCLDWSSSVSGLSRLELRPQSFAGLLTGGPPEGVKEKLLRWGVTDYISIFARGIGLNSLFCAPPPFDIMSDQLLRNYHRYADALYACFMDLEPYTPLRAANFQFCLYASGEYSRMLETEWETEQ